MNNKYQGWKLISNISEEEYSRLYSNPKQNPYGLLNNEYLIKENESGKADIFQFIDKELKPIRYIHIDNKFNGKISPRNPQQAAALSLLYDFNKTIKVISGKFGSGKTFLMCGAALDLIQKGKFDKIIWVRNNFEVKNTKSLGFLPGDAYEKLLPFAMPLADQLGGEIQLQDFIRRNIIEIQHLGFIRGRDLKNSIVISSEAENLTKEHIQLLIGRIGQNSQLWLDGDYKQMDNKIFEENNGLLVAIEKLKEHKLFGCVDLIKSERSETSAIADLLD